MEKEESVEKPNLMKRLAITGQLTRFFIYLSASIPTVILIVLAVLTQLEVLHPLKIGDRVFGTPVDYLVLALLIFTGVFGIYEFIRLRRIRKIDARFPDFVRDLAESRRAGMTFTKAIMYSAKGNYGPLTPEIQKIARQISWGSSVDNALNAFAKRVNTKLIRRTVSLIVEASRSGGNVADVLDAASKDARELKLIDAERRANMLSYVAVIYVGMGVFLLILMVLTAQLIPEMTKDIVMDTDIPLKNTGGNKITAEAANQVFYYGALIQSIGMGLVAGVFEEGEIVAGVKHIFIMVLVTWIFFKLIIGL